MNLPSLGAIRRRSSLNPTLPPTSQSFDDHPSSAFDSINSNSNTSSSSLAPSRGLLVLSSCVTSQGSLQRRRRVVLVATTSPSSVPRLLVAAVHRVSSQGNNIAATCPSTSIVPILDDVEVARSEVGRMNLPPSCDELLKSHRRKSSERFAERMNS